MWADAIAEEETLLHERAENETGSEGAASAEAQVESSGDAAKTAVVASGRIQSLASQPSREARARHAHPSARGTAAASAHDKSHAKQNKLRNEEEKKEALERAKARDLERRAAEQEKVRDALGWLVSEVHVRSCLHPSTD
jgi:hypothetical protein